MISGFKQTDMGPIPNDWDLLNLSEIGTPLAGLTYSPEDVSEFGLLVLRSSNVQDGQLAYNDNVFVKVNVPERVITKENDILICVRNGSRQLIGKCALIDRQAAGSAFGAFMSVFRAKIPGFAFYQFQSEGIQRQIRERMGATINQITNRDMSEFLVPVPQTDDEQRAIATVLSNVDALIASLDKLIAKKRAIKTAAMQQLLTGKKRLPGFVGEWEVVKAGDIGQFRGGNGFPTVFQGEVIGDYPFFKVSDMNNKGNETFMHVGNNYISEGIRKRLGATVFPAESIVFAKVGAAVFLERKKILNHASCIDNNLAAYVLDSRRAYYRYIHYVFLDIKLGNLVSTTALPSLSGGVLSSIELPLPPLPEQKVIVSILSDMDNELTALESRLDKTKAIKQGMMQELLTGRTRLI